ncbi:unnamed protein product [Pylaiella littoralis]
MKTFLPRRRGTSFGLFMLFCLDVKCDTCSQGHRFPPCCVRYGTVRYGTVRYGTVRYGKVRYEYVAFGDKRDAGLALVVVHRVGVPAPPRGHTYVDVTRRGAHGPSILSQMMPRLLSLSWMRFRF